MASSMFSIAGIASGLDTEGIVNQLVALERQPIVRYESRQAKLRTVDAAWGTVTTKLSAIRAAVDKLDRASDLNDLWKVSSSNTSVVAATRTPGATSVGSEVTLRVDALAKAQQTSGTVGFASRDAAVDGTTFRVLAADGVTELGSVDLTAGVTLDELATAVDAFEGVTASVVKVADGDFRLTMRAEATGTANAFSIDSDATAFDEAADLTTIAAADARVTVGGLTVVRSSNTITDLVDGVTLDLKQASTEEITVATTRDVDAATARIKSLVDAMNGALASIKSYSSYNADTGAGGALVGSATARAISNGLRDVIASPIAGVDGVGVSASTAGIELTRDGTVKLDEAKLRTALTDDPDAVFDLFIRNWSTSDPRVSVAGTTTDTRSGVYEVRVTQAAQIAAVTGASFTPPPLQNQTFTITKNGVTATATVNAGDSITTAVQKINAALEQAQLENMTVSDDGDRITLSTPVGSEHEFELAYEGVVLSGVVGAAGTYRGSDVVGTIGGRPATGDAWNLTSSDGPSTGLSVDLDISAQDVADAGGNLDLGTVGFAEGLAGRLSNLLRRFEGAGGEIQRTRDGVKGRIDDLDDRIAAHEVRVELREATLRRQFTALEGVLAQLNSQSSWLSQQLGASTTNAN